MIYYVVTEIGTEVGLPAMLEKIWAIHKRIYFLMTLKMLSLTSISQKTKPITVGIFYRPPNQTNFIKTLNESFAKLDTTNEETYILGDFNTNLYHNDKYITCKSNTLISRSVPNGARNYHQFCTIFILLSTPCRN